MVRSEGVAKRQINAEKSVSVKLCRSRAIESSPVYPVGFIPTHIIFGFQFYLSAPSLIVTIRSTADNKSRREWCTARMITDRPQKEVLGAGNANERELEAQAIRFAEEAATGKIDDKAVLNLVGDVTRQPHPPPHNVSLAQVSTYIYQSEISKNIGNKRIVFPTFASHWAVIVSEPDYPDTDLHGYHLTFEEEAAAQLTPPPNTSRRVVFSSMLLDKPPIGAKQVGTTYFSHPERMKIGRTMIEAFGSYHRVFWNCQHFARLYLSVITGGGGSI